LFYATLTKKSLSIILIALVILGAAIYGAVKNNFAVPAQAQEERLIPIYNVSTQEKKIAVTFNAAWEADEVKQVLSILKEYNAKCTFFVVGDFADRHPEAIKAIAAAGHEICNHSDSHPDMTTLTAEGVKSQILECEKKINQLVPDQPRLFRVPSGGYNNMVVENAEALGYQVIQWDADSRDWQSNATLQSIVDNSLKCGPGSIILFHIGTQNGQTPAALPKILSELQQQGYEFVKVSELILPAENSYVDANGTQNQK